jgi:hypothetical protein
MGMDVVQPLRGRRLVALLGVVAGALAAALPARADFLAAALRATPSAAGATEYGPGDQNPSTAEAPSAPANPLLPLAVILAVPAGTQATDTSSTNSVVKSPGGSTTIDGGDTATTAGSTDNGGQRTKFSPEPAGLVTALIGSAVAGLGVWRRRRARRLQRV